MKRIINLCLSALLITALLNVNYSTVSANENQTSSPKQEFELNHYEQASSSINFDSNWKFFLGEATGAESLTFQDLNWKDINLPHDYSLSQDYTENGEAESGYKLGGVGWYRKQFTLGSAYANKKIYLHFDGAYMNAEVYVNGTKVAFHPYGYTAFKVDITDNVKLDGTNLVAVKTDNPVPTSRWYSGSGLYRSVYLESSDKLHFESYGVKITTPDLNQNTKTNPKIKVETKILNETDNASDLKVRVRVFNDKNTVVAEHELAQAFSLDKNQNTSKVIEFNMQNPRLWDVDDPYLYRFEVELLKANQVIDKYVKDYGLRYFEFLRETGFKLNGRNLKLKGVSMHHDQGALGAAAYYDAIERQVLILKQMGVNSIRVTHNPSARHLKDAANKHGILLIEEAFDTWSNRKNGNYNDYSVWFKQNVTPYNLVGAISSQKWSEFDVKQMTKEGLNDASIIMWSIGNEIFEGLNTWNISDYPQIATDLATWIDEVDGTRYVTFGDNKLKSGNHGEKQRSINVAEALHNKSGNLKGIIGYNYANGSKYDEGYNNGRNWIIYGSETASSINSRGIYNIDRANDSFERQNKLLTSYDERAVPWGHSAKHAWYDVITRDYVAGEYVWTGFDYLGEPTPWNNTGRGATGGWPSSKSSYFGIVDTAGLPKDSFYFYQSQWNDNVKTLHILPQWNRNEIKLNHRDEVRVVVYSDAKAVELFRLLPDGTRGESLGRKEFTERVTTAGHKYQYHESDRYQNLELVWNVAYQDGGLEAVAYDSENRVISNTVGNNKVRNYGSASKLVATANKDTIVAKKQNLIYVEIDVKDQNNILVANARNNITVTVNGPAKLVGLDNGNQVDHQSYQDNNRNAFAGKLVAIVESTGEAGDINVVATSSGLQQASVTVKANAEANNNVGDANLIKKIAYSPIIYIKKATQLTLPSTIDVERANTNVEQLSVNWNLPSDLTDKLNNVGSFVVTGNVDGLSVPVSINVVVIDKIAALLNYSTATLKGTAITLPETRRAVAPDGSILDVSFPVKWQDVETSKFNEVGEIKVSGTATVFGEELTVTANIRITEPTITQGTNVAQAAKLSEDTPDNQKSDTLKAITDGNKRYIVNTSNTNANAWSNYKRAQAGVNHSTISFGFDTAQNINKAIFYYFTDTYATALPKDVEFTYNIGSGDDIAINKTVGRTVDNNNIIRIEYNFDKPVPAVILNAKIINNDKSPNASRKATTGIYEVELITATQSLEKHSTSTLETLNVNGKDVDLSALENNAYNTEALKADVKYTSNNAAVTLLPVYNNVVKMIVESENQSSITTYTINLATVEKTPASDGSRDIPHNQVRLEAGNEHPRADQLVGNANDGRPNTIWHTNWWNRVPLDKLYVIVENIDGAVDVEALRYQPRQGGGDGDSNGRVNGYQVYSSNDKVDWDLVTQGSWDDNGKWKVAEFPNPVKAKYFKLQATSTYGNPANKYMSAAEVSLRKPKLKTDIQTANITVSPNVYLHTGKAIRPLVQVELNGVTLKEDIDYVLVLENNIDLGTNAVVKIKGISSYSGEVARNFTIIKDKIEITEGADLGFKLVNSLETDNYYAKIKEVALDDSSLAAAKANIEALGYVKVYNVELFNKTTNEKVDTINSAVETSITLADEFKYANTKLSAVNTANEVVTLNSSLNETNTLLKVALEQTGLIVLSNLADKTQLAETITSAETKLTKTNDYTSTSLATLQPILDEVKVINKQLNATQKMVNDAYVKLDTAIRNLVLKIHDSASLQELVDVARTINLDDLKPSSATSLTTAIKQAQEFIDSTVVDADRNAQLYKALTSAINDKQVKANFDELNRLIAHFEALTETNYTTSSYQQVKEKIAQIKASITLEENQSEVSQKELAATTAISELVEKGNAKSLQTLFDLISAVNLDKKTLASKEALKQVLAQVEKALADIDNLSQKDIDDLSNALSDKYSELEDLKVKHFGFGASTVKVEGEFADDFNIELKKPQQVAPNQQYADAAKTHITDIEVYEIEASGDYQNSTFTITLERNQNRLLEKITHISKVNGIETLSPVLNSDGTATVVVKDLSPFILSYNPVVNLGVVTPNKEEKVLPKTGTSNRILYSGIAMLAISAYFILRSRKED